MFNEMAVTGLGDQLVSEREIALKEFTEGLQLIARASARVGVTLLGENVRPMSIAYCGQSLTKSLENGKRSIDNAYWKKLFDGAGLTFIFNSQQLDEFYFNLKSSPEFTVPNITSTVVHALQNRPATIVEGLVDAFSKISKSRMKTNEAVFKLPKRFIVEKVFDPGRPGIFYGWNQNEFHLNDIEKALFICNGEPVPQKNDIISEVLKRSVIDSGTGHVVSTRFLDCRVFINGNVHSILRNDDDLEAINNLLSVYYGDKALNN